MAHNTVETDTYEANVVVPDSGDNATALSVETGVQDVANRTKFLLAHLQHATNLDNTTASRTINGGAKRLRCVNDMTALAALVVGAANDREIVLVQNGGYSGLWQYEHGSAETPGGFNISAAGATGDWFFVGSQRIGTQPGIPAVSAAGLLQGVSSIDQNLVDNRIAQLVSLSSTPTDEGASTTLATSNTDAYVEGFAQNISSLVVGDKLVIDVSCHGENVQLSGTNTSPVIIGLFVDDVLKATAFVDRDANDAASGNIKQVNLKHVFTATGTSHEIEVKIRSHNGVNIEGKLYVPLYGTVMVIRP